MSTSLRVKTTVNFSQSQAVAQNLLCASMCEILWRRKLLPEECFDPMVFAKNKMHKIKEESTNHNTKAAKLLTWIKEDVCKGIKEKVLEKVILSVHSSEKLEAESVIEAYSFSFTYVDDKCSDNVEVLLEKAQRMEIDAEQSPTVDNKGKEENRLKKAKLEVADEKGLSRDKIECSTELTVRNLLSLLEHCEELPEEHFISYTMCFNHSEAVKDFKPSNCFRTVDFDGEKLECGLTSTPLPVIKTGFHEIAMCLNLPDDNKENPSTELGKRRQSYKKAVKEEKDNHDVPCSQEPDWNGQKINGPRCSVACKPIHQA